MDNEMPSLVITCDDSECSAEGYDTNEWENISLYCKGDDMVEMYMTTAPRSPKTIIPHWRCMPCFIHYNMWTRRILELEWLTTYTIMRDSRYRGPTFKQNDTIIHKTGQEKCLLWMLPPEIAAKIGLYLRKQQWEILEYCTLCKAQDDIYRYHLKPDDCPALRALPSQIFTRNMYNAWERATPEMLELDDQIHTREELSQLLQTINNTSFNID
jgi:hypothetical protein